MFFGFKFLTTSVTTSAGIKELKSAVDTKLLELSAGNFETPRANGIALTARHKQVVSEAIENTKESINELKAGNDEVTAMMLRAAYKAVSDIEQEHIDEQILDRIFGKFCVGK